MKTKFLIVAISLLFASGTLFAQKISKNEVPSLVINSFQQAFPKASDIDWKRDGELYKVDFEIGIPDLDHDVWYENTGKLIKHKEEISKSDLPKEIKTKIETEFADYKIDDIKKITEEDRVNYVVELESIQQDWKVSFDANGTVLNKIPD